MASVYLSEEEVAELLAGNDTDEYEYVTSQFMNQKRWSLSFLIVIYSKLTGKYYGAIDNVPATEYQEDVNDLPVEWKLLSSSLVEHYEFV